MQYNFKIDGDALRCRICGQNVAIRLGGDRWILSSNSEGDESKGICYECLVKHCMHTNCLECDWYKYPDCPHVTTKNIYMDED